MTVIINEYYWDEILLLNDVILKILLLVMMTKYQLLLILLMWRPIVCVLLCEVLYYCVLLKIDLMIMMTDQYNIINEMKTNGNVKTSNDIIIIIINGVND